MEKIRVLVVDDSLVVRRALRDCFRGDPEIEVCGVAETGVRALQQIDVLKPDVVTLDIEMPEMDGLEALKILRDRGSEVPVIMFSKYTTQGATATLEALELGASDVVAKPEADGRAGAGVDSVKRQLSTRIRALGRKSRRSRHAPALKEVSQDEIKPVEPYRVAGKVEAVGIAISTGGPSALVEVVSSLSNSIHVPIFITQHMPPMFTRFLAERLSAKGPLKALEVEDGMPVEPGRIYVTPGDFHLEVTRYKGELLMNLSQAPHENSCRPSADFMFRSLASIYGPRLLGIVMTGMGQDGRKGAEHIRSMGGTVVAQDEASSLVWGMPRAVVTANLHHAVVPLSEISRVINEACSGDRKERK